MFELEKKRDMAYKKGDQRKTIYSKNKKEFPRF